MTVDLFSFNMLSVVIFVTVFIFFAEMFFTLYRIIFKSHKKGFMIYIFPLTVIAAVFPIRTVFPKAAYVIGFDRILGIEEKPFELRDIGIAQMTVSQSRNGVTLSEVFFWVWLAVSCIFIIKELTAYLKLTRTVGKYARKCTNKRYNEILADAALTFGKRKPAKKLPALYVCGKFVTPFAMGIISPKIIIPSEDYSDEEITLILRHELLHIKRHDMLNKAFLVLFRSFNHFDPFAYLLCRQAFEDIELSADEKITAGLSADEKKLYSELIIKAASAEKMSDVTTHLSMNGKKLKSRISEIFAVKKDHLYPAVLFVFTIFAMSLFMIPVNADAGASGLWIDPFPIERDPYIEKSLETKVSADSFKDAGEKIFRQLLTDYSAPDVPDYCKVESWHITKVTDISAESNRNYSDLIFKGKLKKGAFLCDAGLFNTIGSHIVKIDYNIEYANKCGNTCHDEFAMSFSPNGFKSKSVDLMITKKSGKYILTSIGRDNMFSSFGGEYHFNDINGSIQKRCSALAETGLFDESTSDKELIFRKEKEMQENSRKRMEENRTFDDTLFEYCGCEFDIESGRFTVLGNVYTDVPHGVRIGCGNNSDDPSDKSAFFNIETVGCTELFPGIIYNDTFGKISFENIPDDISAENAEARLKYMMTPRDNTDFTVLAYRNITEKDGAVYADVRFKGRLEGICSVYEYIEEHGGYDDWYMENVRIM